MPAIATTVRSSAAGAMARVGGLLAPSLIGLIIGAAFELAIGLFAVLLLLAAVAVGLIEVETKGRPLGQAAAT